MTLRNVLSLDELWEGEMVGLTVDGVPVVLVHLQDGVHAYEDRCGHQAVPLSTGHLEANVLTCGAHGWCYDACTGAGINPSNTWLRPLPVRVDHDQIFVDVEAGR